MRNRILTFFLVACAVFVAGAGDVNQRPTWPSTVQGSMIVDDIEPLEVLYNLTGWWLSDEASGALLDSSGGGNNITLVNSPVYLEPGVSFNGSTHYGYSANSSDYNFGSAGSVFTWIKHNASETDKYFFNNWDYQNGQRSWALTKYSDTGVDGFTVFLSDSGAYTAGHRKNYNSADLSLDNNAWHHIGFTWDAGTLKLWHNGTEVSSPVKVFDDSFTSIHSGTGPLMVGATGNTTTQAAHATIAIRGMRIYQRALTADEINTLYLRSF